MKHEFTQEAKEIMYRVELLYNGSWLVASHDFDVFAETYETEQEARSAIDSYNEWERSEGLEETSFRVFAC